MKGGDEMQNLMAEMTRNNVRISDIQNLLGCTEKTVRNKLNGKTEFSVNEAMRIRDTYFPGLRVEYLFGPAENTA